MIAGERVKRYLILNQGQCPGVAGWNTVTAVIALSDRMGIVAAGAVEITALQENDEPVSGPVHD
jgi:hypothetical protein